MNGTVSYQGEQQEVEARLKAILVKVGARAADSEEEPSDTFTKMSLWLYDKYGTAGYSQMPLLTIELIFGGIVNAFTGLFN